MERKHWIDIMRACGIFAIVYGHTVQGDSIVSHFLGSFRVAIFFFVMGLTFSYKKDFFKFLKSKSVRLLIPYLFFSLISIIIFFIIAQILPSIVDGMTTDIFPNLCGALYANGLTGYMKWNLPLWFLPCSLVALVIVYFIEYLIIKFANKKQILWRVIYIFFSIVLTLIYCQFFKNIHLPFGAEVAIPMSGFIEIGIICKCFDNRFSNKFHIIAGASFVVLGFVLQLWNGTVSVMSLSFGNYFFLYYASTLFTIIGLMFLSMWFASIKCMNFANKIIGYCGTHTIAILCMHKFPIIVFQYIVPFTKNLLRTESDSVLKNIIGFLVTALVIGMCLVVEIPIQRICPFIFGNKKNKKQNNKCEMSKQ